MRTNPLFRRGIAVVVIALLLALAFAPSINADFKKEKPTPDALAKDEKLVKLVVTEYKGDGTKENKIVRLPESQVEEMQKRLKTVEDLDERLSVYKDYGLIPEDVTSEKLREGMEERAQQLGLSKEQIQRIIIHQNGVHSRSILRKVMNIKCEVGGGSCLGLHFWLGLSFFTRWINYLIFFLLLGFPPFLLKSADVMSLHIALVGELVTKNGLLPDDEVYYLVPSLIFLIGFVGFVLYLVDILGEAFLGNAVFAFAIGNEVPYRE